MDFAFAQRSASGDELTHGIHFNRFVQRHWPDSLRVVPYNAIDDEYAGLIDAALAQLEPIPSLRRDEDVAAANQYIEETTIPMMVD